MKRKILAAKKPAPLPSHTYFTKFAQHSFDETALSMSWSPQGSHVALGLSDGRIALLTLPATAGAPLVSTVPAHSVQTNKVVFCPRADVAPILASGGQDGNLIFWKIDASVEGAPVLTKWASLPIGAFSITDLLWVPNGPRTLLVSAGGKYVKVWQVPTEPVDRMAVVSEESDGGEAKPVLVHAFPAEASSVSALTWSIPLRAVLAASYGQVNVLDILSTQPASIHKLTFKTSFVSVACSPTKQFVTVGTQEADVHAWQFGYGNESVDKIKSGSVDVEEYSFDGFEVKVTNMSYSQDGRFLALNGSSSCLLLDFNPGLEKSTGVVGDDRLCFTKSEMPGHAHLIDFAVFRPQDEKLIITAARDGEIRLWDAEKVSAKSGGAKAKPLFVLPKEGGRRQVEDNFLPQFRVAQASWKKDGSLLAVSYGDGSVAIYSFHQK